MLKRKLTPLYKIVCPINKAKGIKPFNFACAQNGFLYVTDNYVLYKCPLELFFNENDLDFLCGKLIGIKTLEFLSKTEDVIFSDNMINVTIKGVCTNLYYSGILVKTTNDSEIEYKYQLYDELTGDFLKDTSENFLEISNIDYDKYLPNINNTCKIDNLKFDANLLHKLSNCFVYTNDLHLNFQITGENKVIIVTLANVEDDKTGQIGMLMPIMTLDYK